MESTKHFKDAIVREHLLTCLSNTKLSKLQSAIHDDQKIKSRDARQSLNYKVRAKQIINYEYQMCITNTMKYYKSLLRSRLLPFLVLQHRQIHQAPPILVVYVNIP